MIQAPLRGFHNSQAEKKAESKQDRAARLTAQATRVIAAFTAVAAVVGVAQWCILSGQLEVMRTDSAIKREELRAKIDVEVRIGPNPANASERILYSEATNIGKSEAKGFGGWETLVTWAVPIPKDPFAGFEDQNKGMAVTIPEGKMTRLDMIPLDGGTINGLLKNEHPTWLMGRAWYKDIFFPDSPLHHIYFCRLVGATKQTDGSVTIVLVQPNNQRCNESN